ncbi:MAG: flavodoxin-dependent (E)-4-hydroxy-3-methylbut-2-enyl-diphosphate synthase [Clostridia bacterium]|jgi:(E)-4-hydroxy-3-methylbut-2-enyl-diphosphate synthase|nr:flavodoxin-dependent (E)-4-hydroxy-3-methylbut-2-enyl-diphosphate synthase [Clostridia bacterium]
MKYNEIRRKSREVQIGQKRLGGTAPIAIQSMTNTDTADAAATVAQIQKLEAAGCDIVRISVPTIESATTILAIKDAGIQIPIVADIHFDYRIALRCAELGFDKIRINPGNIGEDSRVKAVCDACRTRKIPIRIGVNSGSLEKEILAKHGAPTAEALCESALYHAGLLEKFGFEDTVISIKASTVSEMIKANRLLAEATPYPLHLGVTEAGGGNRGLIKSAVGIGSLLCDGIGDTIRVSLTDDPIQEIDAAKQILRAVNMEGQCGMDIVSCPTCSRTKIDLIPLVKRFEAAVKEEGLEDVPIKVALMGCIVNGPGEAREADIGIAGGLREAVLFRHGEIVEKIPEGQVIERLLREIRSLKDEKTK